MLGWNRYKNNAREQISIHIHLYPTYGHLSCLLQWTKNKTVSRREVDTPFHEALFAGYDTRSKVKSLFTGSVVSASPPKCESNEVVSACSQQYCGVSLRDDDDRGENAP